MSEGAPTTATPKTTRERHLEDARDLLARAEKCSADALVLARRAANLVNEALVAIVAAENEGQVR